jgi:hypothetical protein
MWVVIICFEVVPGAKECIDSVDVGSGGSSLFDEQIGASRDERRERCMAVAI